MERIVQLIDYEYNNLIEKANLNEKQINEQAYKLYKERGVASIDIKLSHKNDEWENTFRFDCIASVWYKDDKFFIPEELRGRLRKIIEDNVLMKMREAYGDSEKLINVLRKKRKNLSAWNWFTGIVAVSGWVSFVLYLCLK